MPGNVNKLSGGGGVTVHNDLTGKDSANQHPASSVSIITTNFNDLLLTGDDTLQKAFDRIDGTLSFKQLALRNIEKMYEGNADVVLTTTGVTDLQTAITALTDGQILEIATNGTYDPITLPAGKSYRIRTKLGYNPKIAGSRCIQIANGCSNVVISGLTIENAANAGGNNNYQGTAITFATQNAKCDNVVFHNIAIKTTTIGSSILLSYHWSVGGDNYANPPQLSELSTRIAFIGCQIFRGCLDGTEGACIAIRGVQNLLLLNNYIDNYNDAGRGVQMQGCLDFWVEGNHIYNIGGGNAEGLKIDQIGTSPFRQSGVFFNNFVQKAIEGIDVDDNVSALVIGNTCRNCTTGISLDDSSYAVMLNNTAFDCTNGITFEVGSLGYLANNNCFGNTTNYNMLNGYAPDVSNISISENYFKSPTKVKFTPEGGLAIKYLNKTGANSIKGYVVRPSSTTADAVDLSEIDSVDPIGFFYESGIPDGQYAWIVVSGRGEVYCTGNVALRDFIRVCVTGDAGATNGQAFAEIVPTPPLATDKHFQEIAHAMAPRVGAGLVMCDSSHKN